MRAHQVDQSRHKVIHTGIFVLIKKLSVFFVTILFSLISNEIPANCDVKNDTRTNTLGHHEH